MSVLFDRSWHATTWLFHYSNAQGVDLTPGQHVTQAYAVSVEDAVRCTGANLGPPPVYRRALLVATESLDGDGFFIEEAPKMTAIGARIFRLAVGIEARHIHDESI